MQGGLEKKDITQLLTRAAELAEEAGQRPSDRHTDTAFVITAALQVLAGRAGRDDECCMLLLAWLHSGAAAAGSNHLQQRRVSLVLQTPLWMLLHSLRMPRACSLPCHRPAVAWCRMSTSCRCVHRLLAAGSCWELHVSCMGARWQQQIRQA